ncbi:DUF2726 domain-containing protein [Novosphingobium sp. ES2-1]|uniref:DUF2726 domain-containing protein n=1 Tax=Novosphingobium sp. ES2-1 TaxID=2780074 RepID=UPI001882E51C|nr:DUF2726 domain-containing protein [Novosphingobium sp. ES2-1]QOV92761.1 DUF2726 domain-containing protein [Novosphingobium sp. ES2-1]
MAFSNASRRANVIVAQLLSQWMVKTAVPRPALRFRLLPLPYPSAMPSEIVSLIDKPHLLALLLAIGAAIGIAVERFAEGLERAERRAFWRGRKSAERKYRPHQAPTLSHKSQTEVAAEQLRRVMEADFKSRPPLNQSERRLLAVLDKALSEEKPTWRAMGQVSLGEILLSDDKDAYWAINSKRVDLLIVDDSCRPVHAVEFQGSGHHLGAETAARDAVKKEALRRAGIGYVEVMSNQTPAQVRLLLQGLLRQTA